MEIDFEIDTVIEEIKKKNPKRILLQFPDGLKPYSNIVYDRIKREFPDKEVFIWLGETFGGCDIPIWLDKYGFDLIIHFGHAKFVKNED